MNGYDFNLGDRVQILPGGSQGLITGRAEYVQSASQYKVRYLKSDGEVAETWEYGADIQKVP